MPGRLIPSLGGGGGSVSPEDVQTAVESAMADILPGGTTAQMMVKASDDPLDFAFVDPISSIATIRAWAEHDLLWAENFDGGIPAELVTTSISGVAGTETTETTDAPGYSTHLRNQIIGTGTQETVLHVDQLDLGGATPSKIVFRWNGTKGGASGDGFLTFLDGEVLRMAEVSVEGRALSWVTAEYVLGADTFTWRVRNTSNFACYILLTGIEVYGVAEPYMLNDPVIYQGTHYVSLQDNNPHTPGSGQGWQEV